MWPDSAGHIGPAEGDGMGQRRRELTPERSPLHQWGAELRSWRDRCGLSLSKLGSLIRYDPSHLARFERAERWAPEAVARACDAALGANGALLQLWQIAEDYRLSYELVERHVASSAGHVANPPPAISLGYEGEAASEAEDGIVVPCRDLSGRII